MTAMLSQVPYLFSPLVTHTLEHLLYIIVLSFGNYKQM